MLLELFSEFKGALISTSCKTIATIYYVYS